MRIRAGAIDIGYEDAGRGMPVILLHGFPHDRRLWMRQLPALGACCRCIAPDLRGFGESTTARPYSMDQYADDLAQLMDALEIGSAVVVRLSMGGYITLACWRRHRARLRALVLADTRAGADSEEGKRKRHDMIALARERGSDAVADAMITAMVGKTTRERQPEVAAAMRAMLAAAPVDGIAGALEAMMARPDSTPTLAAITVPTLIVVGDEDVLTPPEESRAMHAAIAGSRLEVIPHAGHVSNVERPAAFNRVVSDFVARVARE